MPCTRGTLCPVAAIWTFSCWAGNQFSPVIVIGLPACTVVGVSVTVTGDATVVGAGVGVGVDIGASVAVGVGVGRIGVGVGVCIGRVGPWGV